MLVNGRSHRLCGIGTRSRRSRFWPRTPQTWSVLVTDLHMPDVDGRQMARFARSLTPPVPVVLVTARTRNAWQRHDR